MQHMVTNEMLNQKRYDPINHPSHYKHGEIECIDVIEDWQLGYHEGNALKYLCRWKHKNGVEDLKKARWYLDRLIKKNDAIAE